VTLFRIERSDNGGPFNEYVTTQQTFYDILDEVPGLYTYRIRGLSAIGQPSGFIEQAFQVMGKTAPPGDVQNLVAERSVNGVQLTWDEVTDIDVVGYEIREGGSWDDGTVISKAMRGTTLYIALSDADLHTFYVKAIDELGNYSVGATSIETSVVPPDDIEDFSILPDNDRLIFNWIKVDGTDLKYEIREGKNFGSGKLVGRFSGTEANIMYPTTGVRTFWIKALSPVGLYSVNPLQSTASVKQIQSRNVVYTTDRSAAHWPGTYYNTVVTGTFSTEIGMVPGAIYGEHTFAIALTSVSGVNQMRSRAWIDQDLLVDAGSPCGARRRSHGTRPMPTTHGVLSVTSATTVPIGISRSIRKLPSSTRTLSRLSHSRTTATVSLRVSFRQGVATSVQVPAYRWDSL
jgi:hypothetical protein